MTYAGLVKTRITVSLDEEDVRLVEEAVRAGEAPSVSAWVAAAIRQRAGRESTADVLADIRREIGPATEEETAWARSVLGL
jgi:Arc/MetJ-type ribon-helix-helix transcriptional regulator